MGLDQLHQGIRTGLDIFMYENRTVMVDDALTVAWFNYAPVGAP